MRYLFILSLSALTFSAFGFGAPSQTEPLIRAGTVVCGLQVGGMTRLEGARQLRVWWEQEKRLPLTVKFQGIDAKPLTFTPGQLGVTLDDEGTMQKVSVVSPTAELPPINVSEIKAGDVIEPNFKDNGVDLHSIAVLFRKALGSPKPAKISYLKGKIVREHEVSAYTIEPEGIPGLVKSALVKHETELIVPIVQAPKAVPDEVIDSITDVVSSYSTFFPKRQYTRNSNIQLAASKLNGILLMPGDKLSFNGRVGKRTVEAGFKLAGVYKQGRHDTGIGGGICQVSTTLYNAALFANLAIRQRSNHSMPVAYVPIGRDATVDYGALDLVIENSQSTPLAITTQYQPGVLSFQVLGKKIPGQSVRVTHADGKVWDRGVRFVSDSTVKVGQKKVVEKGSKGHSVMTFRLVYENGKLIKKEPLGRSFYSGGVKIIAVHSVPAPVPAAPTVAPVSPAVVSAPLARP